MFVVSRQPVRDLFEQQKIALHRLHRQSMLWRQRGCSVWNDERRQTSTNSLPRGMCFEATNASSSSAAYKPPDVLDSPCCAQAVFDANVVTARLQSGGLPKF